MPGLTSDERRRRSSVTGLQLCGRCRGEALQHSALFEAGSSSHGTNSTGGMHPGSIAAMKRRRKSSTSSLVGSYEESLLSGRMSAGSSPPMSFYSKLGVIGGKPHKTCPRHISLGFDAVFYDWNGHGTEESSPYVGGIDLDRFYQDRKRPGYRIPRHGQIQIVISNPRKTAVQLILVPYDLSDMPANTKTFIRHKVFEDGSKLVQAVHIPIFSPPASNSSKLYIHGVIRTVFQNRVTASTEHLVRANRRTDSSDHSTKVDYGGYSTLHPPCSHCNQLII
ncbi:hypothetical protein TRICI_003288 [Trichomonascus ciferrii]|uniref:Atos-like conserved domain-containing protein n=1 Tax=Trichomonascus ciferrii TaxID=44093 RepID=A0A642VAJ0_9ASCO|nr:hypothetical protein TRICI_003288 [Trichomonascus ciferrii]